jgi:hypothetical protein
MRMNSKSWLNRRRFLGTAARTALVGVLAANTSRLRAASGVTGENDHFWYRLAPEGPYIDSQRDNKALGFGSGRVFLSDDNGQSWAHSAAVPDADNITFTCILKNGNILFATRKKLFLSADNLKSYRQIIVKDREGRDYVPHLPQNPDMPGWYFHSLPGGRPTAFGVHPESHALAVSNVRREPVQWPSCASVARTRLRMK